MYYPTCVPVLPSLLVVAEVDAAKNTGIIDVVRDLLPGCVGEYHPRSGRTGQDNSKAGLAIDILKHTAGCAPRAGMC